MATEQSEYLTTRELAELLRIKERKVYELASSGAIPCSRALGKLLFPRRAVEAWVASSATGIAVAVAKPAETTARPNVFLGSHDPLLDWAIRESRCGLATFFDGSFDGLDRFARAEGIATGLHIPAGDDGAWNEPIVAARFAAEPVVLVEWAWRDRGLIVPDGNPKAIKRPADLKGLRVAPRQPEAGAQKLLEQLLAASGLDNDAVRFTHPARSESDAALAVLEDKADATLGLTSLARQYRLGFVPVMRERFDLLVWRRAWFDAPFQRFLDFARSADCAQKAAELGGYDQSGLGRVHFNGA
jgi:putative molybdopterin biosynthesis protein